MTDPGVVPPPGAYSPQRRTALLLTGTGTAGVYHAGVLRALHEAGIKLDVVAGRGIGAVGVLFAAVDGAQRLWEEHGFWRAPAAQFLYPWRSSLVLAARAGALSMALVLVPLLAMAAGLVVFPIDFLLKMVGVSSAEGLTSWYVRFAERAFAPDQLPTLLPRMVLLVLGTAVIVAAVNGYWRGGGRRPNGAFWWRLVPGPVSAGPAIDRCWSVLWDLVRGAASLKSPSRTDLVRRYVELLSDNLGQPGFRELVIVAHDVDAGRDLVFALVSEARRQHLVRRVRPEDTEARRAEVFDLSGVSRDHLADAVAGALTLPLASDCHRMLTAPDGYWRGERHRLADRPGSLVRLVEELADLGVEQILIVSAAAPSQGPHQLAAPRIDGRGRIGEYLQSAEAAAVRDVRMWTGKAGPRLWAISPAPNPIGPFDFAGGFDDRSGRRSDLSELMARGYEDAYHQFIEPVVGAGADADEATR